MRPMKRRTDAIAAVGVAALALAGSGASAFVAGPSRIGLRCKAPRMLPVQQLQMAGGPRGRSRGGLSIEGADGAQVVLTSSTKNSVQSRRSLADYSDDEMVEGASSGAVEQGMEDYEGFTTSQGQVTSPEVQREETLDRKNKFIFSALVFAGIGSGVWVAGTAFLKRQDDLVEAYADEMTYHVGDENEMLLCHKEYKGKLGPKMYRGSMFKSCIVAIGSKKALTLETVRSVKFILKLFKFSASQAMKLLVEGARNTEKTQSNVRSKLYFLGSLISKDDDKAEAILQPLKENLEFPFGDDGARMLQIRMDNMAESAFKSALDAIPAGEVMESGWEELGISNEQAADIATEMVELEESSSHGLDFYEVGEPSSNDEESDPEAAAMLKQLEAGIEAKKMEPQDEKDPEPEGTAKSYECQDCGYKMFVAKGREFKFFGDSFKCPECGAGKNKFTEG